MAAASLLPRGRCPPLLAGEAPRPLAVPSRRPLPRREAAARAFRTARGGLPGVTGGLLGASLAAHARRRQRRCRQHSRLDSAVVPAAIPARAPNLGGLTNEASKIVVALDVDEVLAQYLKAFIAYYNQKRGRNLQVKDFYVYHFWEVTGTDYDDTMEDIYDFHTTDIFRNIEPVPGSQAAVTALAKLPRVELHIVTSRQENIAEETCLWLGRHFPGVFKEERIHIGNHYGRSGPRISKSRICTEIGAGLLIDDSWEYCEELAKAGTPAVLFDLDGAYPWSREEGMVHDLVTRVRDWGGAVDLVSKWASGESA
uniref:5'-nucleotidase n=1 Tax=Alexandrium catenella TaxID=2925 RepID=A0A7S1M5I9_ALECA